VSLHADVAILTDLRFPGGNASSTLDELDTFAAAGLRVLAVHCPANISGDKPVSVRYARHRDRCLAAADVERLKVHTLIVRHPAVVCADGFPAPARRIEARQIAVVINNSMFRARGEPAYDPWELSRRVGALQAEVCRLFPIGPLIRQELERFMPPPSTHWLGPFDWTPTFDVASFDIEPRKRNTPPIVIGRHGRDSAEKWLEDAAALRHAYPPDAGFEVHILGGAEHARRVLGTVPDNWRVTPFGGEPPADFLARLDAFVYFPHTGLREAFGRGVVEAACAGLPCVLPRQLEPAFGDLAFFCEPQGVIGTLHRLFAREAERTRFVEHARRRAQNRFSSQSLFSRLEYLEILEDDPRFAPAAPSDALHSDLANFKRWVETGVERAK
jgi:glycosyltransferase involved in cell wall biosynthesis